MSISLQRRSVLVGLCAFVSLTAFQVASAQNNEDLVHMISGVVKHVDKGTKTVVVKADDGTEHTIKWTGKTTWEGTKDAGKGIKDGSHLSVKYTEKAGEKTAVGVKDLGKDTEKAVQ
jgi:hypothetical protein